ncbi:uncharacterized protein LOC127849234 [Dreissena polymorpha]|uniref:uncharacterized protein LOC127849234 n=1 Tax=Dreissena polymorpha TaxID=45954 RepID=UPI002264AB9A|nr:uncharacterized protein LOC127849234 [Dreissena polymorpha]
MSLMYMAYQLLLFCTSLLTPSTIFLLNTAFPAFALIISSLTPSMSPSLWLRASSTNVFLGLEICLLLAFLSNGDIQSPRHCKNIMECAQGEICHVYQKTNEYGDVLYDLGCTQTSMCLNRTYGNHATCDDCCNSDLCNAAGCGNSGYPPNRGPICYSCSSQTTPGSCHSIDFCGSNEVCLFYEEREFGDSVYTYKCAVVSQCERYKPDNLAIVGRYLSEEQRSVTETICHRCCNVDLCNKHCGLFV